MRLGKHEVWRDLTLMFEVFVYIVSVSPTPDMKTLQFETGSFGLRSFEISTTRHLVGKPIDWFFVVILLFVWFFLPFYPGSQNMTYFTQGWGLLVFGWDSIDETFYKNEAQFKTQMNTSINSPDPLLSFFNSALWSIW